MARVAVIGGGRWARTIATALCRLPGRSDSVTIHSRHVDGAAFHDLQPNLPAPTVTAHLPTYDNPTETPDIVFIANAAHDHYRAALQSLSARIPTFVEKPAAIGAAAVEALIEAARLKNTLLATSNVFLFARYLDAFAGHLDQDQLKHLRFQWADGRGDLRHGEIKHYDPSITVFDDVLPHVVPIVMRLGFQSLKFMSLQTARGGAKVVIEFAAGDVPITIELERNGPARQRRLTAVGDRIDCSLDFTHEPGVIASSSREWSGDPAWGVASGPLASMLETLLASVESGVLDARLDPRLALAAARLADEVRDRYVASQSGWLTSRIGSAIDEDLQYALRELQSTSPESNSLDGIWPGLQAGVPIERAVQSATAYQTDVAPKPGADLK